MADCYVTALRILGYRFNSEAELRRKLAAKRFDGEEIAETLARLREEKWLDDDRFAAAYVRTRVLKGCEEFIPSAARDHRTMAMIVRCRGCSNDAALRSA